MAEKPQADSQAAIVTVNQPKNIVVTVNPPKNIDLKELARLTGTALDYLTPFVQNLTNNDDSSPSKVSSQALLYVGAIDLSIKAAQYGFSASEDILNIFAQIKQEASEKAISDFLQNILLHAQNAHQVVDETLGRFRAVRQSLYEIIEEVSKNDGKSSSHSAEQLQRMKHCIKICEKLVKNVSMYADWWSCIHLQTHGQVERVEHFQLKPTSMRQKASTKRWKEMKTKFSDYTVEIEKLRNRHAEVFQRAVIDAPTTSVVVDVKFLQEKQERTTQPSFSRKKLEGLPSQENVVLLEGNTGAEEHKKGWPRRIFEKLCCCRP